MRCRSNVSMTTNLGTREVSRRSVLIGGGISGLAVAGGLLGSPATATERLPSWRQPLIIGHRGASGHRPEHTLAAYQLAIDMGADVVEPDLVSTKDGHLVARHENAISETTDVADHPEFADRRKTKLIDGIPLTDWFTEDFTLAELRTLRAEERLPDLRPDNTRFDGKFRIPTLREVIDLVRFESKRRRRRIGIYPETKHPTYFRSIGLPLEPGLLRELQRVGWTRRSSPVFIQSFEVSNLRRIRRHTDVKIVQLVGAEGAPYDQVVAGTGLTYADMVTPAGLRRVSRYADGLGPDKEVLIPLRPDGSLGRPTDVVDDAHAAGLVVHPYTFRNENEFLADNFDRGTDPARRGRAIAELLRFFELGIDGAFCDFPNVGVEARWRFLLEQRRLATA
jgi:glycerophosphoryl diester phosphodiesterase